MRKTIFVTAVVVLAWIGYMAWPVYTLLKLSRAVEAKDVATVMTHVDLPSVRHSMAGQIMERYLRLTGKSVSPFLRGLAGGAAAHIADPLLAKIASPEAMMELLLTGWPAGVPNRPADTGALSGRHLGSAWNAFWDSRYGIRRFEISVPLTSPHARRFVLELRLKQWRWQLVSVTMPEHLQVQLAQSLGKSLGNR